MLSAISHRLGLSAPQAPRDHRQPVNDDDDDVPAFPAINSQQRAKSSSTGTNTTNNKPRPPPPTFSFNEPDQNDKDLHSDDDDEDDERGTGNALPSVVIGENSLAAPATSTAKVHPLGKRRKFVIEKGYSQLDWAKLQRSGEDLRNGITSLQRITREELASHRTKNDCWQAYGGKVYDVTAFLKYHPGGVPEMMRVAGKDGTELFMKTHAWVNVDMMLDGCLIGFLVRD